MKQLVSFFFVLVIFAGVAFFVLKNRDLGATAIIIPTANTVQVTYPDGSSSDVHEQLEIPQGTSVKTDSNGEATIIFADNSVLTMDFNTEIKLTEIPTPESSSTSIFQLVGNTWSRVQSVTEGGSYEVETPSLVAAVRGTSFGVGVEDTADAISEVIVTESNVDVSPIQAGRRLAAIRVAANHNLQISQLDIEEEIDFKPVQIGDRIQQSNWFQRSQLLDQKLNEIKEPQFFIRPEILRNQLEIAPDLRTQILGQIEDRKDQYQENLQLLGLQLQDNLSTESQEKLSKLKSILENPQKGYDYCKQVNSIPTENFDLAVEHVYQDDTSRAGGIFGYIAMVNGFCMDGYLDDYEADFLLFVLSGELTEGLWQGFQSEMKNYIDMFFGGPEDEGPNCDLISETTLYDFEQGLIDIENQYGIPHLPNNIVEDYEVLVGDCNEMIIFNPNFYLVMPPLLY